MDKPQPYPRQVGNPQIDLPPSLTWIGFVVVSLIYFACAIKVSASTRLVMDETLAVLAAQQPTMKGVFAVIWVGSDFSPPTYHFLLHALAALTGRWDSNLLWRFPSIVGAYGAGLGVYILARRYYSPSVALLAFGLVLTSSLFTYATEVREYALMVFFVTSSLVLWDSFAASRRRGLISLGLWVCCALCLSLHFYGFVGPAVVGTAEVLWLVTQRTFRPGIWIPLVLTIPVELAWMPLARHLATFNHGDSSAGSYYAQPTILTLSETCWKILLDGEMGFIVAVGVLTAAGVLALRPYVLPGNETKSGGSQPERIAPPLQLIIILVATGIIPLVVYAWSLFLTGSFSERYTSPSAIFFPLLVALFVDRMPLRPFIALPVLALSLLMLSAKAKHAGWVPPNVAFLKQYPSNVPMVVENGRDYIDLNFSLGHDVPSNLIFLVNDPGFKSPDPTNENEVRRLQAVIPSYHVAGVADFLAQNTEFYLLCSGEHAIGSYMPWLLDKKWTCTLVGDSPGILYRVRKTVEGN